MCRVHAAVWPIVCSSERLDPLGLPALELTSPVSEPLLAESVVTGDAFLDEVDDPPAWRPAASGSGRSWPWPPPPPAPGTPPRRTCSGAVAVELVHLASLYHDDVMDEATMRRNVESVNCRFGNLVAIVAGDFLLARSAEIAAGARDRDRRAARRHARASSARARSPRSAPPSGSTAPSRTTSRPSPARRRALMATSCRIGALTGGLDRPEVDAFTDFGRCFGMVFQVRDDILDVVGDRGGSGKPAGQDLAEGIYTLPVLLRPGRPGRTGPSCATCSGQPLGVPEQDEGPGDRRRLRRASPNRGGGPPVRATRRRRPRRGLGDGVVARSLRGLGLRLVDGLTARCGRSAGSADRPARPPRAGRPPGAGPGRASPL